MTHPVITPEALVAFCFSWGLLVAVVFRVVVRR